MQASVGTATGMPLSIASTFTRPSVSTRLAKTNTPAEAYSRFNVSPHCSPRNETNGLS